MTSPLPAIMELDLLPESGLTLELPAWIDTNCRYEIYWDHESESWLVCPF